MTDRKVYNLLIKIDNGYEPTKREKEELANVLKIVWRSYKFSKIPESTVKLSSLQSLCLWYSHLSVLPENIGNLTSLKSLDLRDTQISILPASVGNLANLRTLSLSSTLISELPESIRDLTSLRSLNLRNTRLSALPESIGNLTNLQNLNLGDMQISALPESIENLTNLRSLNLTDTNINSWPKHLENLTSLRNLDLSYSKISSLPESIWNLTNLRSLNLRNTQISELSEKIGQLKGLQFLDLSNTKIIKLPEALGHLEALQCIVLDNLSLVELPENLLKLNLDYKNTYYSPTDRQGIYINGLKLQNQPIEVFNQSRELIVEYYKLTKSKSTLPINECKVVFLGYGGAGKSLIIDRLMHDSAISDDFKGESTPGICISSKKYQIGDEEIELHFWDFGGQEIMHSMHRLFLTSRTLYVVVANARDNKANEQAWYWIKNIKSFANNAPVLLLVNQKDQNPSVDVNVNGLRKEYAEIKEVRVVSALMDTKEDFDRDIRDMICQIVSGMETVRTPFPRAWLSLMNDLQEMKEDYITSDAFYTKCSDNHVDSKSSILDQIIAWYQDLGVCFYSKANLYAKRYMVLKPRWLLNAIYIVAFNGRKYAENGIIREKDLFALICEDVQGDGVKKVWNDIKYKTEEIQYIIYVLLNYELIHWLDKDRFFVPMLCDNNEPEKMDFVDSEDVYHVSFEYTYLPENVLHLLMVRHGYELNTDTVWRTGAVFERRKLGWRSLVRIKDNYLDIYARSDDQRVHPVNTYLDMMRESINNVNDKLGLTATEYIAYRKDGLEDRFRYKTLVGSKEAGQLTIYSEVFESLLDINEILGIINSPRKMSENDRDFQIEKLLNSLMVGLRSLQGNSAYYNAKEDMCNSYIRDLLQARNYICKDHTLHGTSATGKSDGEPDIVIRNKGMDFDLSIYEALKLSVFGGSAKEYLMQHLVKLLKNYNPTGITDLFLVSYVSWSRDRFDSLAREYCNYVVRDVGTEFKFVSILPMDDFSSSFIRCYKVGYDCGEIRINVYHVIVRVAA